MSDPTANPSPNELATLAGGCFWCTEAVFNRARGVHGVTSGYIGGEMESPTYEAICTGQTGHAEAIRIEFDPGEIAFEDLLNIFFQTHDPTTLNRQGADVGTQYRSAIFPHNDRQETTARAYIAQLDASGDFDGKIVTTIEPMATFYPAEEYHRDYFARNPRQPYCQAVVAGKVAKFDRAFADKYGK